MSRGLEKKTLLFLLCIATIFILATTSVFAASNEKEPNNSFGKANRIIMGDKVNGQIIDSEDRDDFYCFTAPVSGKVKLICNISESDMTMHFCVYDSNYKTIKQSSSGDFYWGVTNKTYSFKVKAGKKYYIRAYNNLPTSMKYSFKTVYHVDKPVPKKITSKKKSFKITWKKVSGASGYQVRYIKKSTYDVYNWTKAKTATVGKKSSSKTIKGLAKKKSYYVQVRAIRKIGGKKYYSTWSKKKAIKVK